MNLRSFRENDEVASQRLFTVALVLSAFVHGLLLWTSPSRLDPLAFDVTSKEDAHVPLVARIVPPQAASPEPPQPPPPAPSVEARLRTPPVVTPPRSTPPPLVTAGPALRSFATPPTIVPLAPAPPLPEPRTRPQLAQDYADLSAYVAARRRARGEPAEGFDHGAPTVAATLDVSPAPGESRHTGGLFQITLLNADRAEFTFFGWNRDIKRRMTQRYEVERGREPDIRTVVVRRMIAIIREYEQEDFEWRSNRLGRDITLSARPVHTAELEAFLMREFFGPSTLVR